jgi:hypothetical protein
MRVSGINAALLYRLECQPVESQGGRAFIRVTAHRGNVVMNQWDIPHENIQSLLEGVSSPGHALSIAERLRIGVAVNVTITGHDLMTFTALVAERQTFAKLGPSVVATIDAQTNNELQVPSD